MSKWQYYVAGAGAAALTSLFDFIKDQNNGTVARVGSVIKKLAPQSDLIMSTDFWAIVIVILVGLFLCWIYQVSSKVDAFVRGCGVLVAFSLGAPSPILNPQHTDSLSGYSSSLAPRSSISLSAFAQSELPPAKQIGSAYIVLVHIRDISPIPESIVTVEDYASRERIAIFSTQVSRIEITQPYGSYFVKLDTPGFASAYFELQINSEISAYDVTVSTNRVPVTLQKLLPPAKVDLTEDDAEKYKQLGKRQVIAKDYIGALDNYRQALSLNDKDIETLSNCSPPSCVGPILWPKGGFRHRYG